jgi:hypothetical protein
MTPQDCLHREWKSSRRSVWRSSRAAMREPRSVEKSLSELGAGQFHREGRLGNTPRSYFRAAQPTPSRLRPTQDSHFAATKTACSRSSLPASIETLTP